MILARSSGSFLFLQSLLVRERATSRVVYRRTVFRCTLPRGFHAYKPHHSSVFMFEKVTVIVKDPDCVWVAKIHAHSYPRILKRLAIVIWHINRVAQERLVYRSSKPVEQHKVNLVNMERM